jgi:hypothetical protein
MLSVDLWYSGPLRSAIPAVLKVQMVLLVLFGWLLISLGTFVTVATVHDIPLNPQSSLYDSIENIWLDDIQRVVVIKMRVVRRCENPTFLVRLSGTALYWLKKHKQEYTPPVRKARSDVMAARTNTYYFAYPPVADGGDYFLDVLCIYCTEFDPKNYLNVCVEDYKYRDITLPKALPLKSDSALRSGTSPRWKLTTNESAQFMPTRYQKLSCTLKTSPVCKGFDDYAEGKSLWQHRLYDWVGGPDWRDVLPTGVPKICMVGCSHARDLHEHGWLMDRKRELYNFIHIDSRFPNTFDLQLLEKTGCDYAIMGYGQWMVATQTNPPCTQDCYETAVREVTKQVAPTAYNGTIKMFFRSMNYNGLRAQLTTCPAFDYRTPPVVDMLNSVMERLCREYDVPYIDLTHIMGPMWDSAQDYSHPTGKVFTAEVEWLLHSIFTRDLTHNRTHALMDSAASQTEQPSLQSSPLTSGQTEQPSLQSPPLTSSPEQLPMPEAPGMGSPSSVAEGSLVRFHNRDTTYVMQGGVLHALPQGSSTQLRAPATVITLDSSHGRKFAFASSHDPTGRGVAGGHRGHLHQARVHASIPNHPL